MSKELPKYLYRKDDGEVFVLRNGKYELELSQMHRPHRYTYDHLLNTGAFSETPPIKDESFESTIKRCPFCGAKVIKDMDGYWVIRHSQSCWFFDGDHDQILQEWQIKQWNQRASEKQYKC